MRLIREGSRPFDTIEDAARFYFPYYKEGEYREIKIRLKHNGYNEDFIDTVFEVMSDMYDEEELYWDDLDESVNVVYDKDGKTERFYLDFDNPDDLYRELEKHCGYDFATQFRDEFEHWKEINIDEARDSAKFDMTDIREILGEALDSLEKVSISIMMDKVPEIDELRDIVNEVENKIGEAKSVADDFFNYGLGSED